MHDTAPPALAESARCGPWGPVSRPAHGELHLWPWSRELLRALPLARIEWLPSEELARLERLPAHRRDDALRVRCAVRAALAAHLDTPPQSLSFSYGSHGKPELATQPALQFSLSHSRGRVLLAVSGSGPVGVDVERVRHPARDAVAERMLGPQAWLDYRAQDDAMRARAFAHAWAEREALVKAMGLGIGDGWELCRALFDDLPLQVSPPGPGRVAGWHVRALPAWTGWVAVVCTASELLHVHWQLPPGQGEDEPVPTRPQAAASGSA
jgi:phosphopantetheine--protein transferase-like protein